MGMNICVMKPDKKEDHPLWDSFRYAGDREFAALAWTLPRITNGPNGYGDDWIFIRPEDFSVWRKAIEDVDWPNPGRYESLLDILEREQEFWIYLSY